MTALSTIARRLKGATDDQLAVDVARLETALGRRPGEVWPTLEDAADAGRSWARNMRGPLQERANLAAVAVDSREGTFDAALEVVACYIVESEEFAEWLARRAADEAKHRGVELATRAQGSGSARRASSRRPPRPNRSENGQGLPCASRTACTLERWRTRWRRQGARSRSARTCGSGSQIAGTSSRRQSSASTRASIRSVLQA
jgi:hypothetical protein